MKELYSDRILKTKPSFIREILKYAKQDGMISFAGGLPNPIAIPTDALAESSQRVFRDYGYEALQYSNSEGLKTLRELIADRYEKRFGLKFSPDEILITTGSQQGNDLVGKAILNKGDKVLVEKPAYLGAIQILSMFEPEFIGVNLENDGPDLETLEDLLKNNDIKLMYTVPNFQNPTGITYSLEKREKMRALLAKYNTVLIEDDPYGELRWRGEDLPYIGAGHLEQSVLFGSFSKVVSPGLRVGYLCTRNKELMQKMLIAKQAIDLHTDVLAQYIIQDYLLHNNFDAHIAKIKKLYHSQCSTMVDFLKNHLSDKLTFTDPDGGMFVWASQINGFPAMDLFQKCIKHNVAFVPGDPFYTNVANVPSLRLNYTNSNTEEILTGMQRIYDALQ